MQYACHECGELRAEHGMLQSMSRAGDNYEKAMMDTRGGTLKTELVHVRRVRTHEEARGWSNGSRTSTSEQGSAAHLATCAPRHSRRPREPDRIRRRSQGRVQVH